MIKTLLGHQWKAFWRSRDAGKSMAIQLVIGFFTIYMLVSAIGLGFFLQLLLRKAYPGQDIIKIFYGFILYYFLFDVMIRFLMQDLPTLTIQPYLIQNIQRKQLIRFLNVRSLFTVLNLLPLLLFTPFIVMSIGTAHGYIVAAAFMAGILSLTVFNHFLVLYVKRKSIISSWWLVMFFVVMAVVIASDYYRIFSLSRISSVLFSFLQEHIWVCILLAGMAALAYFNNYSFLLKNLYLEDIVGKGRRKEGADYTFLNRFGTIGVLAGLDIKLILRNKRPRSIGILTIVFLFYGFIFYKEQYIKEGWWGALMAGGIFLTGLFVSNYGQFLFAWQSAHFDGLMASNLSVKTYIKSKFALFTAVCTIVLLLTSLYGLLSWKLLLIQLAGYLYNVGVHTVIAVFFATHSYKGIDIGKGSAFNYQGMSAEKWIYAMIVFLVPMIIYWPFALFINSWAGILALGIMGLLSFLLQDWWVDVLTKEFFKRKYKILSGFRER